MVDHSTWLSHASLVTDPINNEPKKAVQGQQKKRKSQAEALTVTQKKLKISANGTIAVDNGSENIQEGTSHQDIDQAKTAKETRKHSENEDDETYHDGKESSVLVDLSNTGLSDNDLSSEDASVLHQRTSCSGQTPICDHLKTRTQVNPH